MEVMMHFADCRVWPVPGFCKSASKEEVAKHGYVLTPGRYVGAEGAEDDGMPFEERIAGLRAKLDEQFRESDRLEAVIRTKLGQLVQG